MEEASMATLIGVDGNEIEIHPFDAQKGLLLDEMFSLVGQPLELICLNQQGVLVVNTNTTVPEPKNYRATKLLQFFTGDRQDEVRGAALLASRAEIHVENWTLGPFGDC
jgi:hypothetical protein